MRASRNPVLSFLHPMTKRYALFSSHGLHSAFPLLLSSSTTSTRSVLQVKNELQLFTIRSQINIRLNEHSSLKNCVICSWARNTSEKSCRNGFHSITLYQLRRGVQGCVQELFSPILPALLTLYTLLQWCLLCKGIFKQY